MSIPSEAALGALQWHAETGEPYLPLRHHKNIYITPMRWSDKDVNLRWMNDERVALWLSGPPYPYTSGTFASLV